MSQTKPEQWHEKVSLRRHTSGSRTGSEQKACPTWPIRRRAKHIQISGDLLQNSQSYLSYVSDIYSHLLHMSVKPYFLWLSLNWMCKNCHIHQQQFHTQCLSISNCCNLFSLFSSLLQRSVLNCIDCTLVVYFKSIIYCSVDYKYSIVCIQVYI